MPDSSHHDVMVRSRSHVVFCLGVAAFCAIFVIGGALVAAGRRDPVPQIVLALVFLLLAGAAVKWSRSCVVFAYSRDVLIVHNPLRTYTIALPDIYGFDVRESPLAGQNGMRRTLVDVKRKDGARITCIGACALGRSYAFRMRGQLEAAYSRRPR
jgi:hypothetical protein